MAKKILLVGCGQLGSRHLQAVASLKGVTEVHVVDPSPEAIELGKSRLSQVADLNKNIKFSWFEDLDKSSQAGDLCLIATQAKGRCQLIERVAKEFNYKKFLIEKIVSQSVEEYESLISFCKANDIAVWVNCKKRAHGIQKYIKSKLKSNEPIIFSSVGGNHGLANNGVHQIDLFVFYDGSSRLYSSGLKIDDKIHPSKRGKEIFDLSGSLYGYSDRGSKFMLSFSDSNPSPDLIVINAASSRFLIDHFQKFAYESYLDQDWQWSKILIDEEWRVSHMSKKFVSDILTTGNCQLPTLEDCYLSHEFILNNLLPHFNRLLKRDSKYCPVT
ncbi:MAG: Gfo/Idh/MocA family oxidoreductase [Candidatus Omnitrophota bacterium]|jgi:predicted dehydrogenase